MSDFTKLRANSGKASLDKLSGDLAKLSTPAESWQDNRFWYPNIDKAGNGFAVIRFLPAPGDESTPFVRLWEHSFKGPTGQWYIENSRTTLGSGNADPVAEVNSKLWNVSTDDDSPTRKQARAQKRNLRFICNIFVIEDKLNPENNGKVFLFKFGKKIFDKINSAMNPAFEDEQKFNPFDLWAGANFKIKIRTVDKQRNYDQSGFADTSPLSDDDGELETIWKQEHSVQAFISESNFKPYVDLKKRLDLVLGNTEAPAARRAAVHSKKSEIDDEVPWHDTPKAKATLPVVNTDDDDEDMEFFKKLAEK